MNDLSCPTIYGEGGRLDFGADPVLLDFGDLDLIFKITALEKLKNHGFATSVFSEKTFTSYLLRLVSKCSKDVFSFKISFAN